MDSSRSGREDHILVVDKTPDDLERVDQALCTFFPDIQIDTAQTLDQYQQKLKDDQFDIVILDQDLTSGTELIELIFRLKTEDYEPSVIVVAKNPAVQVLNELYKFGCHRCIVKDDRWLEELGTAVDYLIRLRKVAHENLILRAKLTEANMLLREKNERLDEFSATVAHDIRGPLGGLSMKLEYLLDQYGELFDDRANLLLQRSLGSTSRLIELVQSMYDYAKLGSQVSEMEDVDLNALIHDVFEDLHFPDELDIQVQLDELPIVWGAPALLRRVFMNLVSNAVRYNDKSPVKISFRLGALHKRAFGELIEILVEDNGPGLPEDEDEKTLFSLFQRGKSGERDSEGSGVGLAVVKRIVELHYGEVHIAKGEGSGACFSVLLPIEPMNIIG